MRRLAVIDFLVCSRFYFCPCSLSSTLFSLDLIPSLMSLFNKQQVSSLRLYAQGVTTVLTYMIQFNDEAVVAKMYDSGKSCRSPAKT